jgi:hypothetical protein
MQNKEVKQKFEATSLKKYGVTRPAQNEKVMEKMKNTVKAKYGCDNAMQCEDVRKKQQAVMEEKYGVTNPRHLSQNIDPTETTFILVMIPIQRIEMLHVNDYQHYKIITCSPASYT